MASVSGVRRARQRTAVIVAALVCVFATALSAREYKTVDIELFRVTIDSDWVPRTTPGYVPIRFDITNMGDARVIQVVAQGTRSFRAVMRSSTVAGVPASSASTSVSQTLRLARGDRVRFTMAIPVLGDTENFAFELREGNRMLERFNYSSFPSRIPVALASVLLVADSSSPFGSLAPKLMRMMGGRTSAAVGGMIYSAPVMPRGGVTVVPPPTGGRFPMIDAVLEPGRLPATWTGYTSLSAVAIGKTEWDQLSDAQKNALVTWVACGGDLILVDGQLADLHLPLSAASAKQPDRLVGRHFFGRVHVLTSDALEASGLAVALKALDDSKDRSWSLPATSAADWGAIEMRGFRLRIPGIDGVPARVYLSILLVFSFIIGPVSFWFLWRRRQRVLLVLTAPIISLVFIVLLAGYALAGEGFGVHGRAATLTILDESTKQAATRVAASIYAAGMTPSGGLRFGKDTAVFPLGASGGGPRDRLTVDLTEAQQFTSGVVQARSPTNFDQITFRAARERLTFTHGADGMSVVNGLDATITQLVYRDDDATYRLDAPLAPGAKHALTIGAGDLAQLPEARALGGKFTDLIERQPAGSYLAVLDRSPFWEPGVPELLERGSFHLVLGWPKGQR